MGETVGGEVMGLWTIKFTAETFDSRASASFLEVSPSDMWMDGKPGATSVAPTRVCDNKLDLVYRCRADRAEILELAASNGSVKSRCSTELDLLEELEKEALLEQEQELMEFSDFGLDD